MVTLFQKIDHLLNITFTITLLVLVIVLAIKIYLTFRPYHSSQSTPFFSPFLPPSLRITSWANASGMVFGRRSKAIVSSPAQNEGHCLVCGGSGSGKTSSILIPTLLHWPGTFFAVDISGDISAAVHPTGAITFAPHNSSSAPYDVFYEIDRMDDLDEQDEALHQLAYLIMPDLPVTSDAGSFFNGEGRKILLAALLAYYHAGMDFIPICKKIASSSWQDLFRSIDDEHYAPASNLLNSFRGTNEQNVGGCKQAADRSISLFASNKNVANSFRRPDVNETAFTPDILETNSVFLQIPDNLLDVYAPVLNLVTVQCLSYFSGRKIGASPTILFSLDEFASLGKMDIIGALQKLRKRNVRIMVIVQSLADLDRIYSITERNSMINNFAFKVVLGASDVDTQEFFAKLIGKTKRTVKSVTSGVNGTTTTRHEEDVWSVDPADLAKLHDSLILLHPDGFTKLKKAPYFRFPTIEN